MAAKYNIVQYGDNKVNKSKKLGKGAYGCVFEAWDRNGKKLAAKILPLQHESSGYNKSATDEINAFMRGINHHNIVRSMGMFNDLDKNEICIFLEYCAGGNLNNYVMQVHPNLDKKMDIMCQCANAIAFLHGLPEPIIHRDIKPENILMNHSSTQGKVKIADFGIAKIMDPGYEYVTKAVGTKAYLAPEIFMGKKYTKSVDVFAMGLVYMALLRYKDGQTHLIPYSDSQLKKKVKDIPVGTDMTCIHQYLGAAMSKQYKVVEVEKNDSEIERNLKYLINQMASFDKNDRPHMTEVYDELKRIESLAIEEEVSCYSSDDSDSEDFMQSTSKYNPIKDTTETDPHLLSDTGYDTLKFDTLKFDELLSIGDESEDDEDVEG